MKTNELKIVSTGKEIRLEIQGDVTIGTRKKIKNDLLPSVATEGNMSLDLSQANMMDVTGIQLAYAWKKALAQNQRTGIVILPESENIKDLFVKTGITQIL